MQTKRQTIAGAVDAIANFCQSVAGKANDMQDRAKDLPLQGRQVMQFKGGRCHEGAVRKAGRQWQVNDRSPGLAHFLLVAFERLLGLTIDHRPDIGRVVERISEPQFTNGPLEHRQQPAGDVVLHKQNAGRGTPLAGAVESRGDHIAHRLLGQGRRIDDHGVQPARLGDKRNNCALPGGKGAVDQRGGLVRSGEGDARNARVGNEPAADACAIAR